MFGKSIASCLIAFSRPLYAGVGLRIEKATGISIRQIFAPEELALKFLEEIPPDIIFFSTGHG